ncbi:Uma2 family endonuclease [Kamptonema cortianum]|nr:Uma2 family endonuclease [Kamptonema cortianum]
MTPQTSTAEKTEIIYPSSDGQPMADSTIQYQWIIKIQGGIDALFREDPNVFVAGDLLWYPVEGRPDICQAPDTMVVFGRPKGDRRSYLQWREDNITPQVVFEIRSHSDSQRKLDKKIAFYNRYPVEEYYLYDPEDRELRGWLRTEGLLEVIDPIQGWVSPRLGVRFELGEDGLELYRPDGQRFLSYLELDEQRQSFAQRAEQEAQRAERLAAKLRELNIDPDSL